MGFLYDNLPFGRDIAECPAFYIYAMFIYFERADKFAADKPQTILAQTIQRVLPDVEDWQVSVIHEDHVVFRFHDPVQRQQALDAVLTSTPVELFVQKVTFTSQGSTVLPSSQVFPAPAPPPPPFPDLGPIINDLETRVHAIEVEEAEEPGTIREVVLTFPVAVPAGAIINIQTGFISTGGTAALQGDVPPNGVTLPTSGAGFVDNATAAILLNGQELFKGAFIGSNEAQWVSTTQFALSLQLFVGDQVTVRSAPPPP